MIADTVNRRIAVITAIQPMRAIGRLKMFRSGSRSINGNAASSAINAPGNAMAPRNWPNSPANTFKRNNWNKNKKYHSGSGW